MTEISVVFPQPEGPTIMRSSPRLTSRSMPRGNFRLAAAIGFVTPRQEIANSAGDAEPFARLRLLTLSGIYAIQ